MTVSTRRIARWAVLRRLRDLEILPATIPAVLPGRGAY